MKRSIRVLCPHCEVPETWAVTDHLAPVQCDYCQEWFILRFIVTAETVKLYQEPQEQREEGPPPFQPDDDPLFDDSYSHFYSDVYAYDDLFDPYYWEDEDWEDEDEHFDDDLPLDETDYY